MKSGNTVSKMQKKLIISTLSFMMFIILLLSLLPVMEFQTNPVIADQDMMSTTTDQLELQGIALPSDHGDTLLKTTEKKPKSSSSEPRIIKSPVHQVTTSEDGKWLAVGSRYTSNNEIREVIFYQWNGDEYLEVGRLGESFHRANALDLHITDLNKDGGYELSLASSDGYLYVFEFWLENGEMKFEKVWQSLFVVNAFDLDVADVDQDGFPELLLAAWSKYGIIFGIDPLDYNASDHWGSYHERWRSDMMKSQALSITSGDFNGNGLFDIMVGSRDGTITIFEDTQNYNTSDPDYLCDYKNGGVHNKGQPHGNDEDNIFDICYAETWSDSDHIWMEVLELESYDIDQDNMDEVVITALSQDVFILDFDGVAYYLERITYEPQLWEKSGAYPIDHWADRLLRAENVTFDGRFDEPMSWLDPDNIVSPYRSGMVNRSVDHFSHFSDKGASALLDWGKNEEAVGGGNQQADVLIHLEEPYSLSLNGLAVSIAQDIYENITHSTISSSDIWKAQDNLTIFVDIDPYLTHHKMEYARYLAIQTKSGYNLSISYIETIRINYRLDSIRSVLFDTLNIEGVAVPLLVVGTSQGNLLTFKSQYREHPWEPKLGLIANSYEEQDFLINAGGAWDMLAIQNLDPVPNWVNPESKGYLSNSLDFLVDQYLIGPSLGEDLIDGYDDYDGYVVFQGSNIGRIDSPDTDLDSSLFSSTDSAFTTLSDYYSTYSSGIRMAFSNVYLEQNTDTGKDHPEVLISSHSTDIDIWTYDGAQFQYNQSLEFSFGSSFFADMEGNPLEISSGDVDGDGHEDLVISNMTNIELFVRIPGELNYTHVPAYFSDIEFELNRYGFHVFNRKVHNMQLVDFDLDGDLDIQLSYYLRPGFTLFEHISDPAASNWVEKREFVHFRLPYHTFTVFDYEVGVMWTPDLFDGQWYFGAFDRTNQLTRWSGQYNDQNTWVVVSDQELTMLAIDWTNNENWGYQYLELWSDEFFFDDRGNPAETCLTEYQNRLQEEIIVRGGDSDGDGLIDGIEGFSRRDMLKTDISDPDTDGDGLSDHFELTIGLDPRDYDSDNDLIPDGEEFYQKNNLSYCVVPVDENYDVHSITKSTSTQQLSSKERTNRVAPAIVNFENSDHEIKDVSTNQKGVTKKQSSFDIERGKIVLQFPTPIILHDQGTMIVYPPSQVTSVPPKSGPTSNLVELVLSVLLSRNYVIVHSPRRPTGFV